MVEREQILTMSLVAMSILLVGCGDAGQYSPQGSTDSNGGVVTPVTGDWLKLTISTGLVTATDNTAVATDDTIIFRQVAATDVVRLSSGDVVTENGINKANSVVHVDAFYLADREITQGQWAALATKSGLTTNKAPWNFIGQSEFGGDAAIAATVPAYGLSYTMITTLTQALNAKKLGFSLLVPTSRQWECAARAGTSTLFSWGDGADDPSKIGTTMLVRDNLGDTVGAQAVGSRTRNAYGFYDLPGSVWEWCSDGGTGNAPCVWGGSWSDNLLQAAAGNRLDCDQAVPYGLAGARLVLTQP